MPSGRKYNHFQQQQLKQLILECMIQRFNREESQAYISGRYGEHVADKYIDGTKANIRRISDKRLNVLRSSRSEFINQACFKRADEIEHYMREAWRLYHTNGSDPYLQKGLLHDLHDYTITLANLYELVPHITGFGAAGQEVRDATKDITLYPQSSKRSREQAKF